MKKLTIFFGLPILLSIAPAMAGTLTCGNYQANDFTISRLTVVNDRLIETSAGNNAPTRFLYENDRNRVTLHNIDAGYTDIYTLQDHGRVLKPERNSPSIFRLVETRPCQADTLPPPGACRADLKRCFDDLISASPPDLKNYCEEGITVACIRLIEQWRQQTGHDRLSQETQEPPPVCREDSPEFDSEACGREILRVLGTEVAATFRSIRRQAPPLPSVHLDSLSTMCHDTPSAVLCNRAAEELWNAGRFIDARSALQIACDAGRDPTACKRNAVLTSYSAAELTPLPATALPCGRYISEISLLSPLDFGDAGLVEAGPDTRMRARLENGQIRVRHDRGDDFTFQPLPEQRLVGLDQWNRYTVFTLDGAPRHCSPPIDYQENPLVADCPTADLTGAEACCARGSLHGCNIAGHQFALRGHWEKAKPLYAKVCEQNIRAGCENLTYAALETGDGTVRDTLRRFCANNSRHVACDIEATTSWRWIDLKQDISPPIGGRPER
ncbi:MAG: hypothetical protein LBV45_06160 [Xanthomonadaceae bacterium]|jgi:hypothetical protein|nr:hypothetical protein [Xanthomonadaceae bacterium]